MPLSVVDGDSARRRLGAHPSSQPRKRDFAPLPEIADVNDFDVC